MARLRIEVVLATAQRQEIRRLVMEEGARVADALRDSGLGDAETTAGIFGRRVTSDALLKDGDRVEVYRPLMVDAKEDRRARALASKRRGR